MYRIIAAIVFAMSLFSCSGARPANLGINQGRLAPCPSSPNCVSSDTDDSAHLVAPFVLALPPDEAWRVVRTTVADMPRTRIVSATADYLHAESTSAVFGFVDDLELHLRAPERTIAVRSASRLGHSDLGVNRRRVENLRSALAKQGVVR